MRSSIPTACYEIYTLKSRSGTEVRPLSDSAAAVSVWAEPYLARAAELGIAPAEHRLPDQRDPGGLLPDGAERAGRPWNYAG